MRETFSLTRRAFAAGLTTVAGAAPLTAAAVVRPVRPEIEIAAERCQDARRALDASLAAYERALPAPHFTIDLTDRSRRGLSAVAERRLFDGKAPKRVINCLGNPAERYVATGETIERDLQRYECDDRQHRRLLYRMRRRAKARRAAVERLEASFRLEELQRLVDLAERELELLAQQVFQAPATSMAAVLVQAKMLSAYSAIMNEHSYATYQAGRFGKVLADGLQNVARAA